MVIVSQRLVVPIAWHCHAMVAEATTTPCHTMLWLLGWQPDSGALEVFPREDKFCKHWYIFDSVLPSGNCSRNYGCQPCNMRLCRAAPRKWHSGLQSATCGSRVWSRKAVLPRCLLGELASKRDMSYCHLPYVSLQMCHNGWAPCQFIQTPKAGQLLF